MKTQPPMISSDQSYESLRSECVAAKTRMWELGRECDSLQARVDMLEKLLKENGIAVPSTNG